MLSECCIPVGVADNSHFKKVLLSVDTIRGKTGSFLFDRRSLMDMEFDPLISPVN